MSSSAQAAPPRSYACQITAAAAPSISASECNITGNSVPGGSFGTPFALAIDPADNIWVSDTAKAVVDKFDSSGSYLAQADGTGAFAGNNEIRSLAYGNTAGRLYVASWFPSGIWSLKSDGSYTGTNLVDGLLFEHFRLFDAVDNSGTALDGSVYIAAAGATLLLRLDAAGNPAPFSAVANNVSGNGIGGPPDHQFAEIAGIASDPEGNVYVIEAERNQVDEFDSTGRFVQTFPGGPTVSAVAVDPTNLHVLLAIAGQIREFDQAGTFLTNTDGGATPSGFLGLSGLAVDSLGRLYASDFGNRVVDVFEPSPFPNATTQAPAPITKTSTTVHGMVDPSSSAIADCHFDYVTDAQYQVDRYQSVPPGQQISCTPSLAGVSDSSDHAVSADLGSLTPGAAYHVRLSVTNAAGTSNSVDRPFSTLPPVTDLQTGLATNVTDTTATLNATFTGDGTDTHYYFEYGTDTNYGHTTATPPGENLESPVGSTDIHADVAGLSPSLTYHYRVVASSTLGVAKGADQTFTTFQVPTVESFTTANVTATSADLSAEINAHGTNSTYRFEYGPTTSYGRTVPVPDGAIPGINTPQSVEVHLTGLEGLVYHFRVVAVNKYGTTTTEDQTFNFLPPQCPNTVVRQQTHAAYLPDCRAYELVSPEDAAGTSFLTGGPNTGYATSPSRVAFVGNYGGIHGADPINVTGDLYASTRTGEGWTTSYIGPPANEAGCVGGPPILPGQQPDKIQNGVLTDLNMTKFLDWNNGNALADCIHSGLNRDYNTEAAANISNSPYVWDASGKSLGRWPSNLSEYPGGVAALSCHGSAGGCTSSAITASRDLTHFVFSTASGAFGEGGLQGAPGSAYDNDTIHNTTTLISKAPNGDDIAQDEGENDPAEVIRFPALSTDGSHILMSTKCAGALCTSPGPPVHLFMRVDDAVTYDVSSGHGVEYAGMTDDGSKVYFTTNQQLTSDDHDTSSDLYMWSEQTKEVSRASVGIDSFGDSDECNVPWTTKCGIVMYDDRSFTQQFGGLGGAGIGGGGPVGEWIGLGGITDNDIASESGDIYFYSPERLDGAHGIDDQYNFYVYRGGQVHYVATFTAGPACTKTPIDNGPYCADGPVARLQVSPDGRHAAFITNSRMTSYDNDGYLMMYTYNAVSGLVSCVSCLPSGAPPTSDTRGSQGGLFMTNDGRAFFTTENALVAQDTSEGLDVYEFVDGRAQLITSGTGTATNTGFSGLFSPPGLYGVSANGIDVYFSTIDTLVGQDRNGSQIKFYDARTNGGFPFNPPAPPCAAADECHGPGSVAPNALANGTAASLGSSGNHDSARTKRRHHKHHKNRKHQRQRKLSEKAGHAETTGVRDE